MEEETKKLILELPEKIAVTEKELLNAIQLYDTLQEKIREVRKQVEYQVEVDATKEEFKSHLSNATKRQYEAEKRLMANLGYRELLSVDKADKEQIDLLRIQIDQLRRTLKVWDIITRK